MKIVIIGIGKLGKLLTKNFSLDKHDITVIDRHQEIVEDIVNEFDVMGYTGNGASLNALTEANCANSDLLIACTSDDELNILSCIVAKKIGIKQTIARVRNPEYTSQVSTMSQELNISFTVNPELDAASEISRILRFPSAIKMETFANNKVDLAEIKIEPSSHLVNKSLKDIREKYPFSVLVCAVKRDDKVYIPKGNFVLRENDNIYLMADSNEIVNIFKRLNIYKQKLKTTMLIGGSKISYYLAKDLIASGIDVKIIERDNDKCEELASLLPQATIINSDATNHEVLLEEGLQNVDSVVTLTGMDETNIIISTYCKQQNVDKIITKVNNENYGSIVGAMGLESVISPREISCDIITRYVRGMETGHGSEFKTLYRLVNNQIEALEFYIPRETSYTGIPLKDLKLKPNVLLACIIREDNVIIPSGKDCIEPHDSVIIFATISNIKDVEDIIA